MMTPKELRGAKRMEWIEDILAFICLVGIATLLLFFWVATT